MNVENLEVNKNQTKPAVNQVELHPYNPSHKLVAYCKEKGIHITAYSPLGSTDSPLYKDSTLLEIAEKKGKTPQQCLLQWGIQSGWDVIPKSVTKERIEANLALDGWTLSDEELNKLSNLEGRLKVCGDSWLPIKVFVDDE
jgi:glycerol 2-dehydrogenase (NADP+)